MMHRVPRGALVSYCTNPSTRWTTSSAIRTGISSSRAVHPLRSALMRCPVPVSPFVYTPPRQANRRWGFTRIPGRGATSEKRGCRQVRVSCGSL